MNWLRRWYPKFMDNFEDVKAVLLDQLYNLDLLKREMDESLKEVVSKKSI